MNNNELISDLTFEQIKTMKVGDLAYRLKLRNEAYNKIMASKKEKILTQHNNFYEKVLKDHGLLED